MKKLVIMIAVLFSAALTVNAQHHGHMNKMESDSTMQEVDVKMHDMNDDGMVYQCPMDWEVLSDEAGECPKCGMKLKEVTVDKAEENLMEHGHKVKGHMMKGMMNDSSHSGHMMKGMMDDTSHSGHMMKKDNGHMGHMDQMMESKQKGSGEIWNKFCPVKGEEVDPDAQTVEYDGKTIGFCCPGCDGKFQSDPEKYMKNLSEDGQEFVGKK